MPVKHKPIPVEEMAEHIAVDETSATCLRWIKATSSRIKAGAEVRGTFNGKFYYQFHFRGSLYYVARVVYALHYGKDPGPLQIDHVNRNGMDNRVENLRAVTNRENNQNRTNHGDLPVGVCRNLRSLRKPYQANITVRGRQIHLGHFATPEEASAAYLTAIDRLDSINSEAA